MRAFDLTRQVGQVHWRTAQHDGIRTGLKKITHIFRPGNPADGGKGLDGVAKKARDYYNPATEILEDKA